MTSSQVLLNQRLLQQTHPPQPMALLIPIQRRKPNQRRRHLPRKRHRPKVLLGAYIYHSLGSFVRDIRKIIRLEFMAAFWGIHLSGLYIMLKKGKGRYKAARVVYIRRCGDNSLYHSTSILLYYHTDDRRRVVGYLRYFII